VEEEKEEYMAPEEWIQTPEGLLYVVVPVEVPHGRQGTRIEKLQMGPPDDLNALILEFCGKHRMGKASCNALDAQLRGFRAAAQRSMPRGNQKPGWVRDMSVMREAASRRMRRFYSSEEQILMTRPQEEVRLADRAMKGLGPMKPRVRASGGALKIGNHEELMRQEYLDLLPMRDPLVTGAHKTCAVVGSSGMMRKAGFGKEIDAHEAVFRMNDAPTAGHETAVGTRTTYRVLNKLVFFERGIMKGIYEAKLHETEQDTLFLVNDNWDDFLTMRRDVGQRVMPMRQSFIKYADRWMNASFTTTGFRTILLAMKACESVTVYGLGLSAEGSWTYSHYRDHPSRDSIQCADPDHDFPAEWDVISELAAANLVRLRWCQS